MTSYGSSLRRPILEWALPKKMSPPIRRRRRSREKHDGVYLWLFDSEHNHVTYRAGDNVVDRNFSVDSWDISTLISRSEDTFCFLNFFASMIGTGFSS